VIDLHLHTTASDGTLSPEALVAAAQAAGIVTMAVTDHDTVFGLSAAMAAAQAAGLQCLAGIEITAIQEGRDVHVLAYGVRPATPALTAFLERQREERRRRLVEMADRLAALGAPIPPPQLAAAAAGPSGKSVGRPTLARALVELGVVRDIREAFDRYLAEGRPAFVERIGPTPGAVFACVRAAGGVPSLAHPGTLQRDDWIAPMIEAGLEAIEVHHPDHDAAAVARYRARAEAAGILVTGGSDYHGPGSDRAAAFGTVSLPPADFDRLADRLQARQADG
jgi:predicted metal-dependent phosphoesterase TrpH